MPEVFERKNAVKGRDDGKEWVRLERKVGPDVHEGGLAREKVHIIAGDSRQRAQLVNQQAKLRVRRPCELLDISRSLLYCPPKSELKENLR